MTPPRPPGRRPQRSATGGRVARRAVPLEESRRIWLAMHARWRSFLPAAAEKPAASQHLAAIIEHQEGARLDRTLDSLAACPAVWRFVILNRSGAPLPVESIDLLTADVEVVEGALAAIGEEQVLLIHSGVAVVPETFEAMARALESAPADGLVPACRLIESK